MATLENNKITLVSSTGDSYQTFIEAMTISTTLAHMLECFNDKISEQPIPLQSIDSPTLQTIINYCETYHTQSEKEYNERPFESWQKNLFKEQDKYALFSLINASSFLDIKPLTDALAKFYARDILPGKEPEEIAEYFACNEVVTNITE